MHNIYKSHVKTIPKIMELLNHLKLEITLIKIVELSKIQFLLKLTISHRIKVKNKILFLRKFLNKKLVNLMKVFYLILLTVNYIILIIKLTFIKIINKIK